MHARTYMHMSTQQLTYGRLQKHNIFVSNFFCAFTVSYTLEQKRLESECESTTYNIASVGFI